MERERKAIFLVDDNAANLAAGKDMLKDKYAVYPLPSAAAMFSLIPDVKPDLILLDIEMPEMDGFAAIQLLKGDPGCEDIPVVFLTARVDEDSELKGLGLGAIDYVMKPFSAHLLAKRIDNHLLIAAQRQELKLLNGNLERLVRRKTLEVVRLQNAIVATVADLVEFRDDVTGSHVSRTQSYLALLLDRLMEEGLFSDEVAGWDMEHLLPSAQLHDVGKIAISDLILNKPGRLTAEEFAVMKTHVDIGVRAIDKISRNAAGHSFLRHARLFAAGHHEKWDGTGYPAGLKGTATSLEGRLMAIADVYDALISRRPYKPPMSPDAARKIILDGSGGHFDPALVRIFDSVADGFAEVVEKSGAAE